MNINQAAQIGQMVDQVCRADERLASALYGGVTYLFIEVDEDLEGDKRLLVNSLLERIRDSAALDTRTGLAGKLARAVELPQEILDLMLEDRPQVAGPILRDFKPLPEARMVEIASRAQRPYLIPLAERPYLPASASIRLLDRADPPVVLTLLYNHTADFDGECHDRAARLALKTPSFQEPWLKRPDLDTDQAARLYWDLDDGARALLAERMAASGEQPGIAEGGFLRMPIETPAAGTLTRLDILFDHVRKGRFTVFGKGIAAVTDLPFEIINRMMSERGGVSLAIVCRALDLTEGELKHLIVLTASYRSQSHPPDHVIEEALKLYRSLSVPAARGTLERWRERHKHTRPAALPAPRGPEEPAVSDLTAARVSTALSSLKEAVAHG